VTTIKRLSFAALIVFGSRFATHVIAEIITASPISGNFALTTAGYEIVFDGTNTFHFDIVGEGLVTADGSGNLSGSANFMATNPSSSPVPASPFSAQCPGTLAGTVAEPGDGAAQIQLQFTPSSPVPSGVGPQEACIPMTMGLSCVEIYPESGYATPPVSSGGNPGCAYLQGCTTTFPPADPTPTATPAPKKKHHRKADGSVIPVDPWPPVYLSSATRLKCIATGVTTTSTTSSVEGESLSLDLQQTAPASVTVPPPVTFSPVPLPYASPPVPTSVPPTALPLATPGANGTP